MWSEGASPWPHEREALAFVRSRLPDHDDTPRGFFLVETKSFPGTLFGDDQRWRLRRDHSLTIVDTELTETGRNARAAASVDDIEMDLGCA